jgi:F-type H+-transporting ATPase subunit a
MAAPRPPTSITTAPAGRRSPTASASPSSIRSRSRPTIRRIVSRGFCLGYGFWKNGLRFLNVFVPKGVPKLILPAIVAIEVLSFLSRPVSHSVRLFANMLAGHITLQVFAGFVIMLGSAGILGVFGATLPFIMVILLYALELLVAFLQAYVFAILTCIYLNDAFHPGH